MMRSDFAAIAKWIKPGSQVLDVGCGDGTLLSYLKDSKSAHVYGVELADDKVLACAQKGLNIVQQNLEGGLALFEDNSFDTVILSQTLQTIHQTARILSEIARVGHECIVSFPNFGHWSHRASVALGRMPVSKSLPYHWYDTPNVHLCTIKDFDEFCANHRIRVMQRLVINAKREIHLLPNLRGSLAMYRLCAQE